MRVLVCGGRDYADADAVFCAMFRLHVSRGVSVVIHGACRTEVNADKLAGRWAEEMGIPVEAYPVDPRLDGPNPRQAPINRNARMLMLSNPHGGVAFPSAGPGTADMVARMEARNIKVWKPYG